MRLLTRTSNPFAVALPALCALCLPLSHAAAQTPTQATPPTQTTSPGAPGATPGTPQSGAIRTPSPAVDQPGSVPAEPTPGTGSAPSSTQTPQTGLAPADVAPVAGQTPGTTPSQGNLPEGPAPLTPAEIIGVQPGTEAAPAVPGHAVVTLDEALKRAQANEPTFAVAAATAKNASLDQSIARAALLPSVIAHNQYLYTQSAGANTGTVGNANLGPAPRFIANNAVHEYVTQASVTETIGPAPLFALSRAHALAAVAKAQLELSRRGLNATVISLFYAASTTQGKVAIQQRALAEAENFLQITRDREAAQEVAHADVLKAELTAQQRQRDVQDAQLAAAKAKLDLAVLLFPDPATPYTVSLPPASPPPAAADVKTQTAAARSPEIASANAALVAQNFAVGTAQAALLPDLILNYSYGIDAAQYAVNGRDGFRNLGYSASATLDLPIFDWFATPDRIRQAHNLRDAAKVTLSAAQRSQAVRVQEFYNEVKVAYAQLDSLGQSVRIAQESLHLTRLRYTAGEATVLEVTDAENTLALSEIALNDGTTRYQLALANLQLLTGTI